MATTKETASYENASVAKQKVKSMLEPSVQNRKTLQTLQYSAHSSNTLVGKDATISLKNDKKKNSHLKKINSTQKPVSVFEDPKAQLRKKSFDDKAIQTEKERLQRLSGDGDELDSEVFELMVQEEVPESYWKEIAEQRRVALNDSLHENETLHKELEELRDENSKLSEMASKADYFADVIQEMLGKDEGKDEENPDSLASGSEEEQCSEDNDSEKIQNICKDCDNKTIPNDNSTTPCVDLVQKCIKEVKDEEASENESDNTEDVKHKEVPKEEGDKGRMLPS